MSYCYYCCYCCLCFMLYSIFVAYWSDWYDCRFSCFCCRVSVSVLLLSLEEKTLLPVSLVQLCYMRCSRTLFQRIFNDALFVFKMVWRLKAECEGGKVSNLQSLLFTWSIWTNLFSPLSLSFSTPCFVDRQFLMRQQVENLPLSPPNIMLVFCIHLQHIHIYIHTLNCTYIYKCIDVCVCIN